jgi:diguanylate cyclase (GGDEF)-like protein/PAS domain S-box-containing protein
MKSSDSLTKNILPAVLVSVAAAGLAALVLYAAYEASVTGGLFTITATALILALLGAGIGGVVAVRRIIAVRELTLGVERLGQGDLDSEIVIDQRGDLGRIGKALDRLRRQLKTTTVSRTYLERVLLSISDAVFICSSDGTIIRINPAAADMLGYVEEDLLGRSLMSLFPESDQQLSLIHTEVKRPRETSFQAKGGRQIPVSYSSTGISISNPPQLGFICVARDISDRKQAERRIRDLVQTDTLTKVPNRSQIQYLLRRAISRGRREHLAIALLQVDLDRFKDINDTYGYAAGDACLEAVAERLIANSPEGTVVGRLTGDAFAVVLEGLAPGQEGRGSAAVIARRILESMREVLLTHGHHIYLTASAGIALYPEDSANPVDLSRNADLALYDAKRSGGNDLSFYDPDTNEEAAKRTLLKSKLRRSYENDELLLRYQPRIDIRDGQIVGAEALVRWELPGQGLVLPSEFIPLAEETRLIVEIGEWVLDRVCADLQLLQEKTTMSGRISVNLSLLQLQQPDLVRRVGDILAKYGVSPSRLEFEITETTLMEDSQRTIRVLKEFCDMGLRLAIDDFGTGYSSLSAVQKFPINAIKIDRSFVHDAATASDDATIVAAIIEMGRKLNIDVVAEGVESGQQLRILKKLGCNFVQGLLFGEPMPAEELMELLADQQQGGSTYQALFA